MTEPEPTPPLVLSNPYASIPIEDRDRVAAMISREDHKYLIMLVFPHHRAAQCLVATFIHKLISEMKMRDIKPFYDESNEPIVAEMLKNLNFDPKPNVEPTKPNPKRKPSTRRAASSVANAKK